VSAYRVEVGEATLERLLAGPEWKLLARTTSGENGAFELDGGPGMVDLTVESAAFATLWMLVPGDEQAIPARLKKANIANFVLMANRKPVAGAVLVMGRAGDRFRELAKSDATGHVHIPNWPPWELITVLHPDFAPGTLFVRELEPGITVRGKVVDEHGKPVANATVFCDDFFSVTSGDDGGFTFEHVRSGAVMRAASDRGNGVVAARSGDVVIQLRPLAKISGFVRDEAKNPIAGMPVYAANGDGSTTAITDEKGAFTLPVSEGKYRLSILGESFFESATIETAGGVTRDITVKRMASIDGVARDEEGKPVGAWVSFRENYDSVEIGDLMTDAAGRFWIFVAPGTKGRIFVGKDGGPRGKTDVMTIAAGGAHDVVVNCRAPSK
jgi:hypothetical protein